MTPSDAALLAAADPDAFRELYARYAERIFGYFVRRSGDHDAAFDDRWAEGADELLDALPESQREAVRLRVVEQLEYEEVALALGTSPEAARVRVHRGLSALRGKR